MGFPTPLAPSTNTPEVSHRKITFVLACLVLVACATSYYQARNNPPGFYIDESSIAYNAYTISERGQDEYGEPWPLYFRAFGEYKNPFYIYLLAFLFRIFGPSMLVARLLSISLGVAAVLTLSWLAFQISQRYLVVTIVGRPPESTTLKRMRYHTSGEFSPIVGITNDRF
jgi:predicted membrane-bound mannosyltransferase